MGDPLVIEGWECSVNEYGSRSACRGRIMFAVADGEMNVEDSTRYYPSGSYNIPAAVLLWLIAAGQEGKETP